MAPIGEIPFLQYIIKYLENYNCTRVVFSVGYMSQVIIDYVQQLETKFAIEFAVETQPLNTGGGIQFALKHTVEEHVLVLNGDTFFDVDLSHLMKCHKDTEADISIALKEMRDFDRYGTVKLDSQSHIKEFIEKQRLEQGLINGGIYVLNKQALFEMNMPDVFSFEQDLLQAHINELNIFGHVFDGYFIDIGIPEDYATAQDTLKYFEKKYQ